MKNITTTVLLLAFAFSAFGQEVKPEPEGVTATDEAVAKPEKQETRDVEVLDFVPVDIVGRVFMDHDSNGTKDSYEPGIEGVRVILSGTTFRNNPINMSQTTDALGNYTFREIGPNAKGRPYTVSQVQPAFFQNGRGGSNRAKVDVNADGKLTVQIGSLIFFEQGFFRNLAAIIDFADRQQSAILFGMKGGGQEWSIFHGNGWDMNRYGNARFTLDQNGESGVLKVSDSQTGGDRTANVSVNNETLTYRGNTTDRVYRVIGGSSLLGAVSND